MILSCIQESPGCQILCQPGNRLLHSTIAGLALDYNLFRHDLVLFGDAHFENTIDAFCRDLFRIGGIRQCEATQEGALQEPAMIDYGKTSQEHRGLGDPIGVQQHSRPVTSSLYKWVGPVLYDPVKERMLREMINACDPEDLETWGYPMATIFVLKKIGNPTAHL